MSASGIDWSYRMIRTHDLDPLGLAVVLHLGVKDHPNVRTDRGIARALNLERKSVQRVTAKLVALGLICRRSGQWVSVEAAKIFDEVPDARRPARHASDDEQETGGRHGDAPPGVMVTPLPASSGRPYKKKHIKQAVPHVVGHRRSPPDGGGDALTVWQRDRVLSDQTVMIGRQTMKGGSPELAALRARLRSQDAEKQHC